jgi:hypothetical protein
MIEHAEHPRWNDPRAEPLRIGHFIDWMDAHSGWRTEADRILEQLLRENLVIAVAAAITGRCRWDDVPAAFAQPHPHVDHRLEYGVGYHAEVIRAMADDELADATATYEQLLRVKPGCISALVNLAEAMMRSGDAATTERLLVSAADQALEPGGRHGLLNRRWLGPLRLALCRFGMAPAEKPETLLAWIGSGDLRVIAARLSLLKDGDRLGREAYASAARSDRPLLRAAIERAGLAPVRPDE